MRNSFGDSLSKNNVKAAKRNKTARISGQSPEFSDCPLIHTDY